MDAGVWTPLQVVAASPCSSSGAVVEEASAALADNRVIGRIIANSVNHCQLSVAPGQTAALAHVPYRPSAAAAAKLLFVQSCRLINDSSHLPSQQMGSPHWLTPTTI